MGALTGLLHHMDWLSMLLFVMSGVACLICLTIHELSHGFVAYRLGDPTAKLNGRLTLNPISHIDWIGLFLLLAVGVGWAKPVPVNPYNFQGDRRSKMTMVAMAGPLANLLFAVVSTVFLYLIVPRLVRRLVSSRLTMYQFFFLITLFLIISSYDSNSSAMISSPS